MSHRFLASAFSVLIVIAVIAVMVMSAIPASAQTAPRTAWGQPDLGGIWDFRTITPLQRPVALADQEFLTEEEAANLEQATVEKNIRLLNRPAERTVAADQVDSRSDGTPGFYNNFWLDDGTRSTGRTSLIIDPPNGRTPPMTPEAQRLAAAGREYRGAHPADSWLDRNAGDRCILGFNAGPPITPLGYNQNLQVLQTPDHVALVTEMVHTTRVVPLDGRPRLRHDIAQWSGDSRGHWEGDTLVVETSNFDAERRWRGSTKSMKLVERFTRIDADTLEYEFTVTDPAVWTSPWTASIPMRRNDLTLFEYACHEGNYAMPNILAGERRREAEELTGP